MARAAGRPRDVRVADAKGSPPNIPFWLGEAPARSDELSRAVSDLRADIDRQLEEIRVASGASETPVASGPSTSSGPPRASSTGGFSRTISWLITETGLSSGAAEQVIEYLTEGRRVLGVIPTQQTLVLERFFDESGGMQLILHAPFGSRINKAGVGAAQAFLPSVQLRAAGGRHR